MSGNPQPQSLEARIHSLRTRLERGFAERADTTRMGLDLASELEAIKAELPGHVGSGSLPTQLVGLVDTLVHLVRTLLEESHGRSGVSGPSGAGKPSGELPGASSEVGSGEFEGLDLSRIPED